MRIVEEKEAIKEGLRIVDQFTDEQSEPDDADMFLIEMEEHRPRAA